MENNAAGFRFETGSPYLLEWEQYIGLIQRVDRSVQSNDLEFDEPHMANPPFVNQNITNVFTFIGLHSKL